MTKRQVFLIFAGGQFVCVVGSLLAILFPPYTMLGGVRWGFLLSSIVSAFGKGMYVYKYIDYTVLLAELVLINGLGLALIFLAARQGRRHR